jgi:hypothetical protein
MAAGIRCILLAVCVALTTVPYAHAENRSFADLLAQAKAQAAGGHRWAPAGDNAAETIMRMIDLIPTATPAQLSELSALIESGRPSPPPTASNSELMSGDRSTPAVPPPPASQPPASPAIAAPAPPPVLPVLPARPVPEQAGQVALGQVPPSPITPNPITPSPITHGPIGPGPIAPGPVAPGPVVPGQAIPDAGSRAAVLFARGLDAELHGDLSGARRFYSSAAQQGDAAAARHLGRLYDPTYLKQTALGGVDPDPALARHWYQRAVRLGDTEAGPLLEALSVR